MTAKWKEISAYTGQPVEEDAPTNFAGQGSGVAMPPDAMMKKKKKKSILDARTKEYKAHQARLETARKKRLENRKVSNFSKKIQEKLNNFERESFLTEDNVDVLRSIVKSKQNKSVKFQDGKKAKVDLFTASALIQVIDKVNPDNKAKLTKMVNGSLKSFLQAQSAVMKMVKMK